MARKLYPLGIQTFSEIRMNDNLYIDKTAFRSATSRLPIYIAWRILTANSSS